MGATAQQVERKVQLAQGRFKNVEFVRKTWHATPAEGHTFEDVLNPEYWSHMANKVKVGDHIEVLPEDQTYWALLMVTDVGRVAARVMVLHQVQFKENLPVPGESVPAEFEVAWKGPQMKWAVIRLSDRSVVLRDFPSREEASKALVEYQKVLSR